MARDTIRPDAASPAQWTVFGISELQCWLGHKNPTASSPTGHDAEDCLGAHQACGIRHVAWDLGRSVLNYHSDLPEATCFGLHELPVRHPEKINVESRIFARVLQERCPLRAAIRYAHHNGMVLYGRLCMNRHYSPGTIHRSWFAQEHPGWCEVDKDGWLDPSRLCFGIPEYREERIAILLEAVSIGVDGLHLDFLRQPPLVRYQHVFVNG